MKLLTFMEVVSVMDIQIPSANVGDTHVVTTQFRRLDVPNDVLTIRVLVSNFHQRCCHAVDSLPVDVESVPRVGEFDDRISFKCLLK